MLSVVSVRMKKHSKQMMKVHMVKYHSISNSFNCDWLKKKKKILGGKMFLKNDDTNYHNKPVILSVTCARKKQIQNFKKQANDLFSTLS